MRVRRRVVLGAVIVAGLAGAGLNLTESRPAAEDAAPAADLRLVLNVPAYRLDVYERGEKTGSYEVAIGQRQHTTPRGSYRISKVVWNPWWHPPASPWARGEKPTPPGPRNPMGRAKLYFRNLYYIHGTNQPGSMGEPASHGCVRMRNADVIELARLVHHYASPDVSQRTLEGLVANSRQTRTVWLRSPVSLDIVYERVEVHAGELMIHRDVYRAAGPVSRADVEKALARAGVDTSDVDDAALADVVKLARTSKVVVPVETVLRTGAETPAAADR